MDKTLIKKIVITIVLALLSYVLYWVPFNIMYRVAISGSEMMGLGLGMQYVIFCLQAVVMCCFTLSLYFVWKENRILPVVLIMLIPIISIVVGIYRFMALAN